MQSPAAAAATVQVHLAGLTTCAFTERALADLDSATDPVQAAGGLGVNQVVGRVMCDASGQGGGMKFQVCAAAAKTGYPALVACSGNSGSCEVIQVGWKQPYASDVAAAIDRFAVSGKF